MTDVLINGWHLGMRGVGQGAYAWRLINGIRKYADASGVHVTVYVPEDAAEELAVKLRPADIEGRPVPRFHNEMINSVVWNHRLLKELKGMKKGSVFFSPGPCWGRHTPQPMVITYHDCIYRHFPAYLGRRGVRKWMAGRAERYLHNAGLIITESGHAARDIAAWTGVEEKNIVSVPAWLPDSFQSEPDRDRVADMRRKYHLPERYWLYLGGYDIRKNIGFLVRAYTEARRSENCPALVLAGNVPQAPAAAMCDVQGARRETGLDHSVLLEPGFIDDDDLPLLYAGAELFVFPSLMEGFGLPPMEAMGCGCPAFVADNSSLREVVTDPSYRFRTDKPDELVALLKRAAVSPPDLNPSFDRNAHDERVMMQRYIDLLKEAAES